MSLRDSRMCSDLPPHLPDIEGLSGIQCERLGVTTMSERAKDGLQTLPTHVDLTIHCDGS
jgi:hypothetical protein